jgi:hypothetical protein
VRIICPYVLESDAVWNLVLQEPVRDFVLAHAGEMMDVSASDTAYWQLLQELWEQRESFIVIEHDVIPSEEGFQSLASCSQPWCACPIQIISRGMVGTLGCAKFDSSLMEEFPTLMEEVGSSTTGGIVARHWTRLDVRIHEVLTHLGVQMHEHTDCPARHLHYEDGGPKLRMPVRA